MGFERQCGNAAEDDGTERRHCDDNRPRYAVTRDLGIDQHDRTDHKRDRATNTKRPKTGGERLANHEYNAKQDQRQAGIVYR